MHSSSFCLSVTWSSGVPFKVTVMFVMKTFLVAARLNERLIEAHPTELLSSVQFSKGGADGSGKLSKLEVDGSEFCKKALKRFWASLATSSAN